MIINIILFYRSQRYGTGDFKLKEVIITVALLDHFSIHLLVQPSEVFCVNLQNIKVRQMLSRNDFADDDQNYED